MMQKHATQANGWIHAGIIFAIYLAISARITTP